MPDLSPNDRGRDPSLGKESTDPQCGAALLLVESLIHGLIDRSLLSVEDAVEIIDIATDVERQLHSTGLAPPDGDFRSVLAPMALSLRLDLDPVPKHDRPA